MCSSTCVFWHWGPVQISADWDTDLNPVLSWPRPGAGPNTARDQVLSGNWVDDCQCFCQAAHDVVFAVCACHRHHPMVHHCVPSVDSPVCAGTERSGLWSGEFKHWYSLSPSLSLSLSLSPFLPILSLSHSHSHSHSHSLSLYLCILCPPIHSCIIAVGLDYIIVWNSFWNRFLHWMMTHENAYFIHIKICLCCCCCACVCVLGPQTKR